MSVVYLIGEANSSVAKIGTSVDASVRLAALQTGSPVRIHLLATAAGTTALENALHKRFSALCVHGEWFDFGQRDRVEAFRSAVAETLGHAGQVTVHRIDEGPEASEEPSPPLSVRDQLRVDILDWIAGGDAYYRPFREARVNWPR
jgi:hypothetical protein